MIPSPCFSIIPYRSSSMSPAYLKSFSLLPLPGSSYLPRIPFLAFSFCSHSHLYPWHVSCLISPSPSKHSQSLSISLHLNLPSSINFSHPFLSACLYFSVSHAYSVLTFHNTLTLLHSPSLCLSRSTSHLIPSLPRLPYTTLISAMG